MGIFERFTDKNRSAAKNVLQATTSRTALYAFALEPRMLFDGAVAATTDATLPNDPHPADANNATAAPQETQALLDATLAYTPPAAEPPSAPRTEIVFIESNVADYQTLINDINPNAEVHLLDAAQDGLAQMAQILGERSGIDAIHIFSHGSEGSLKLGSVSLTTQNLQDYSAELAAIGGTLNSNGDILLYGCDIAAGSDGAALISALAQATQADIAASTDQTGAASLGGDWILEAHSGVIDAADAAAFSFNNYGELLDTITFTGTEIDYSQTSFTRTISGVTITFTGVENLGYSDFTAGSGRADWLLAGNGSNTKFTISSASGYSFDITSFLYYVTSANTTITINLTYANGSTVTENKTATLNATTTLSSFTNTINDVTSVEITSTSTTGGYDFSVQDFVITDVKAVPTVSSATYNASTGALVITGTGMSALTGSANDIDATKFTFTGQSSGTYTLTSATSNVEITSATSCTLTLAGADKTSVNALLNANGLSSSGGTVYNLAAAAGWNAAATYGADLTSNAITVSGISSNTAPTLSTPTAASYTDTSADDSFSNTTGTLNGADVDSGTTLTYGISSGTTGGSTVISSTTYDVSKVGSYGTLYVKSTTGAYVYVPTDASIEAITSNTTETFTVSVSDGTATTGATYTVSLTGANDTPSLTTPTAASYTDTSADDTFSNTTGTLSISDRDSGQTATYGISGGTTGGSTVISAVTYDVSKVGSYGTLYVKSTTGAYVYVPTDASMEAITSNTTETFTVSASDGTASGTATYTVSLTGANDTPSLTTPTAASYTDTSADDTFSNTSGTLSSSERDSGQTMTYGISGGTTGGSTVISTVTYDVSKIGSYGTLYVKSTTGAYVYVPTDASMEAISSNTTETFTVSASDGTASGTATYTVSLTGANDTPSLSTPTAASYTDTSADDTFSNTSGTLSSSERDSGQTMTYGISGGTTGGSTVISTVTYDVSKVGSYGTLYVKSSDGSYVYVPTDASMEAITSNTTETFTVSASDGTASGTATYTVSLTGANDTPTLSTPTAASYTDTSADDTFSNTTGTLSISDRDSGQTATYGISGGTTGGSTVISTVTYDVSKVGSYGTLYVKSTTGAYVYVPTDASMEAITSNTTETFTVSASDGTASGTATYTVSLTGANDTPSLTTPTAASYTDTSADNTFSNTSGTLSSSERDSGQTMTYGISSGTTGGSTVISATTYDVSKVGSYGTLYVKSSDGSYVYVPTDASIEAITSNTTETFTVSASDGTASGTATYTVSLTGANDSPTLSGGPYSYTAINTSATSSAATVTTIVAGATYADLDSGAVKGIAVSAVSANGNWQYSTDGSTWTNFGTVSTSAALLLSASTQVRYVASATAETATFTFYGWDTTSGTASSNGSTSTANVSSSTAFSSGTAQASIAAGLSLSASTSASYTDTSANDTFSNTSGTLTASNVSGTATYGISSGTSGGSTVISATTYDVSKAGTYGTLYVKSTTGAYVYVPTSDAALNAITSNVTDAFTITVTDTASSTGSTSYTVSLTGANDTPSLTTPTAASYTDTSADDTFSNTTGTLSGSDRDTAQTKTYGISGGTTGGSTVISTVTYDVSKVGSYGTLYVKSSDGSYVYVPTDASIEAITSNTTETFTVSVSDGTTTTSATYTVSLTAANDTPSLTTPTAASYTDTSASDTFSNTTGTLSASDRDSNIFSSGLVAYWAFNEGSGTTVSDSGSNNISGSFISTPTWSTDVPSAITYSDPYSLNFAGTGNAVSFTWPTSLNFAATDARTFSFWYKPVGDSDNDSSNSKYDRLVSWTGYQFEIAGNLGNASVHTLGVSDGTWRDSGYTLSAGTWYHLTVTYDGTTIKLYVNDSLQYSAASSGKTMNGTMYIGLSAGLAEGTNGLIDDMRLYNTALTSSQIANLTAGSSGLLTYGISSGTTGGSTVISSATYDVSKTGTYGTLYVKSSTGAYVYVPTNSSINALTGNATDTFTVTASDGTASTNSTYTVSLTGANDTPSLTTPTAASYTDTSADNTFSNTTGTLSSSERDSGQTMTYGISSGTTGGSTVISATTYDVSKVGSYGTLYVKSSDGSYVYVPTDASIEALTSNTTETFTVSVSDGTTTTGATYTVSLTGANDSPSLSGGPYSFTSITTSATSSAATVTSIIAGTTYADLDSGAVKGIAVSAVSASGNWQYSTDNSTWTNFGSVSSSAALLLSASTYVRYVASSTGETATFTFYGWDTTSGTASSNGSTSTANVSSSTAFSSGTAQASISTGISLSTPTAASYTDTSASDSFSNDTGTLSVSGNSGTLTYGISSGTTGGSSVISSTTYDVSKAGTYGTLYVKSSTGAYVYVPTNSSINAITANTTESFTISATNGSSSATATYTVSLTGANDTPTLSTTAASYTDTSADDTFSNTSSTFSGADRDSSQTLTYAVSGATTGGSTVISSTTYDLSKAGTYGTLYVKSTTGAYVYVPTDASIEALTSSTTESFTVSVSDGTTSTSATYTVSLTGANDSPSLTTPTAASYTDTSADDSFTTNTTGTLSSSERDSGQTATYGISGGSTGGSAVISSTTYDVSKVGSYGTLYVKSTTGAYVYVPTDANMDGASSATTDTFTVSVSDGTASGTATYTVSLSGANDTPTLSTPTSASYVDSAASDSFSSNTGTLSASDRDSGTTLTYGISGGSVSSGVSTLAGSYGSLSVNTSTGAYTYTPTASKINALTSGSASDSFTVSVSDGSASTTATYTVSITGANDTPTLSTPTAGSYTDTAASDTFSSTSGSLSGSDSDSGASLTYGISGGSVSSGISTLAGSYGSLAVNTSTGVYTYTPTATSINALTSSASDSFTVTVSDGSLSTTATYTVNITGANDTPTLSTPTAASYTDTAANDSFSNSTGTLSASDADTSASLTYGISGGTVSSGVSTLAGSYGNLSVNTSTGAYTYTPTASAINALTANTTDTFTVSVSDGSLSATATYTVSLTTANDTPTLATPTAASYTDTAASDSFSTNSGTLSSTDRDSGQTMTYGISGGTVSGSASTLAGSYGSLSVNTSTGAYTYTPTASAINALTANATDSFTVSVSDGSASATATYTVSLTGVNDTPTLTTPTAASYTDTAANDSFSNSTGTLSASDADTSASLTYGISGGTVSGGVSTLAGSYGSLSVNTSTGAYTYTPTANSVNALTANATDSFTVSVSDGSLSTTATYTVSLTAANDTPTLTTPTAASYTDTAADDTFSADSGTLSASDRDNAAALTYGISGGTISDGVSTLAGSYGSLSVNTSTGAYTYTPNDSAINATTANTSDTFTVSVSDGSLSTTASYTVSISAANDTPTLSTPTSASYTDTAALDSFSNASGTLSSSDRDSGQTMTYGISGGSGGFSFSETGGGYWYMSKEGSYGTLYVDTSSGAYVYKPNATAINAINDNASLVNDSFTMTLSDGVDTIDTYYNVSLYGTNDQPIMTAGATLSYSENAAAAVIDASITLSDADHSQLSGATVSISSGFSAGDVLALSSQNSISGSYNASSGVLTLSGTASVAAYQTALRSVTYYSSSDTPASPHSSRSIAWTVSDGALTSSGVTSTIAITAINDAPSFTLGTNHTVLEDAGAQTVTGWASSLSSGPADESSQTLNFSVSNNNNALFSVQPRIDSNGNLTYTPTANAHGSATVTVQLQDSGGTANGGVDTSASQTFTITVEPVNDAPTAPGSIATQTASRGNAFSYTLPGGTFNDIDAGDKLSLNATLFGGKPLPNWLSFNASTGEFSGTPKNSDVTDTPLIVRVTATDSKGAAVSLDFALTVLKNNHAPVAHDDSVSVSEKGTVTGNLLSNDTDQDVGDTRIVTKVEENGKTNEVPLGGSLNITLKGGGLLTLNADGSYHFDSNGAYNLLGENQQAVETIKYTISDSSEMTSVATLKITIEGINDAPIVEVDKTVTIDQYTDRKDAAGNTAGLSIQRPVDPNQDKLTIKVVELPATGQITTQTGGTVKVGDTLSLDTLNTLRYTPSAGFNGMAGKFIYSVSDGRNIPKQQTVHIDVKPIQYLDITTLDAVHAEGSGTAGTPYTFTVHRTGDVSGKSEVFWQVDAALSATSGKADISDFTGGLPSGSVIFNAGETSKTVSVQVNPDGLVEANESFSVRLINTTVDAASQQRGLTLRSLGDTANGTIQNDDSVPTITKVSVVAPRTNDKYVTDEKLTFSVKFSAPVTVTGTPQIGVVFDYVNKGNQTVTHNRAADYVSGSGSDTLIFAYTLGKADIDTNGISLSQASITLPNNTSIADSSGNNATLAFTAPDTAGYTANAFKGVVIDGYFYGATVFADANRNGVLDSDEASDVTDMAGNFVILGGDGPYVQYGGTDISTNLLFQGIYEAPPRASVINPLTTLLVGMAGKDASDATFEATQVTLKAALGIDANVDLLNYDPFYQISRNGASSSEIALALATQAEAAKIANLQTQGSAVLIGAATQTLTPGAAGEAINQATADYISARPGQIVNLADTTVVQAILSAAGKTLFGSDTSKLDNAVEQAGDVISASNSQVDAAVDTGGLSGLTQMVQAQVVSQGAATEALELGTKNESLSEAVTNFTGTNLTTAVQAAETGTIVPVYLDIQTVSADRAEGNGQNQDFTFTVTRSGDTATAFTVDYRISGDVDTTDFGGAALTQTLSFAAGETQKTVTLSVSGDTVKESDEAFKVTLSKPTIAASFVSDNADGVIRNDDPKNPIITLPTAPALLVNTPGAIKGISVDDADSATLNVTLTASGGQMSLSGPASINGNGSSYTLTGNVADINTTLDSLIFTGTANTVTGSLQVSASDGDASTVDPTQTLAINMTSIPTISLPTNPSVLAGTATEVIGVRLSDVPGATHSQAITVTLTCENGSAALTPYGDALITSLGDNRLQVQGSFNDVDNTLVSLEFTAVKQVSKASIQIDLDDGNPQTDNPSEVLLMGVVSAPENLLSNNSSTVIAGISAAIDGVKVDDFDSEKLQVTLTPTGGEISLAAKGDVTSSKIDAHSYRLFGSLADLNATLATLGFTGAEAASAGSIKIVTSDLGVITPAVSSTYSINIQHAPTISLPDSAKAVAGSTTTIKGISVNDIDPQIITVKLTAHGGSLSTRIVAGATQHQNSNELTITGTAASISAALAELRFTPSGNSDTASIRFQVDDGDPLTTNADKTFNIAVLAKPTQSSELQVLQTTTNLSQMTGNTGNSTTSSVSFSDIINTPNTANSIIVADNHPPSHVELISLTSIPNASGGHTTTVNMSLSLSLSLKSNTDTSAGATVNIPPSALTGLDMTSGVQIQGSLSDGRNLPQGITVDSKTGAVTVKGDVFIPAAITVKVLFKDGNGNEAVILIKVLPHGQKPAAEPKLAQPQKPAQHSLLHRDGLPAAKLAFSEQLHQAGAGRWTQEQAKLLDSIAKVFS